MAEFLAWIDDAEPLTVERLVAHVRLDSDAAEELDDYLSGVVIPGARQVAETRAGAAIRKARYRDTRESVPRGALQLDRGQAYEIESLTIGGTLLDPASYRLVSIDSDSRIVPASGVWPSVGLVEVIYKAGIDIENYPSVVNWMLLAAAWMLEQPSMFTLGEVASAVPSGYVDSLLAPITVEGRV